MWWTTCLQQISGYCKGCRDLRMRPNTGRMRFSALVHQSLSNQNQFVSVCLGMCAYATVCLCLSCFNWLCLIWFLLRWIDAERNVPFCCCPKISVISSSRLLRPKSVCFKLDIMTQIQWSAQIFWSRHSEARELGYATSSCVLINMRCLPTNNVTTT